jgi:hypothetical protein
MITPVWFAELLYIALHYRLFCKYVTTTPLLTTMSFIAHTTMKTEIKYDWWEKGAPLEEIIAITGLTANQVKTSVRCLKRFGVVNEFRNGKQRRFKPSETFYTETSSH